MSELVERAQRILESVQGDEQIEVYLSSGVDTEVQAYQGEIENLSSATSSGIGIRVLRDSASGAQVGTAWAGSLDEEAVSDALREARDNARFATEDEYLAFARPDGVAGASLELSDPSVLSTPIEEKIAMAIELERMVRGGDARIRQVDSANYSDYVAEAAIVSTTGIRATYARSGAYVSVEAIATDGVSDQTGWGLSAGRAPRDLDLREADTDAWRGEARFDEVHRGVRSAQHRHTPVNRRRGTQRRGSRVRPVVLRESHWRGRGVIALHVD
jgi:PmbA protein